MFLLGRARPFTVQRVYRRSRSTPRSRALMYFIPFAVVKQHNKPVGIRYRKNSSQEWRAISVRQTQSVDYSQSQQHHCRLESNTHTCPCPICNCTDVVLEKNKKAIIARPRSIIGQSLSVTKRREICFLIGKKKPNYNDTTGTTVRASSKTIAPVSS